MVMMKNKMLLFGTTSFGFRFRKKEKRQDGEGDNRQNNFGQLCAWRERHQLDVKYVKDNCNRSTERVTKVLCADNV